MSTLEPAEMNWPQKVLAYGYFYSRMPALVRYFRDQYELEVEHTARWPKLSVTKRTQPKARILCYHRVNDDNDPYFPAISTGLFEQEMRFVHQHYRVVSLSELLNWLDGESAEPVVAITFDDGYQDNYLNAFPILERYGLPATIFLTTGGLDCGEPLWFEQLALALKTTAKQSIDLELDGQPCWVRTAAERMEANSRIFGHARGLPDEERRRWLARVLQHLEFRDDRERRGKILMWDQVRAMHKSGIEFGGHTVTHPFLSRMSSDRVQWEVSECKRRIEEELQSAVAHFAYPNGREEDFGAWNKDLIRKAGYRAALSTIWGVNDPSTDRMELRRGGPWEKSPALFAYKLDWYQLVNA